jgi:ankyrin repeat protein
MYKPVIIILAILLATPAFIYTMENPNEGLRIGLEQNDDKQIKKALSNKPKGAEVNKQIESGFYKGYHPLHAAVLSNNKDAAALLIAAGAHLNCTTEEIGTSLMLAIAKELRDMAKFLIRKGADINQGAAEQTPLSLATEKNLQDIAELLIKKNANTNIPGLVATAIKKGNIDLARLLLKNGAQIDTQALRAALFTDNISEDILKLLKKYNNLDASDIKLEETNTKNWDANNVPLALKYRLVPTDYFKERKEITKLALIHEDIPLLRALIKANIDVNDPNLLLHAAQWESHPSQKQIAFETFIAAKTNVNAQDDDGNTPLMILVEHFIVPNLLNEGDLPNIKLLKTAGGAADLTRMNKTGKTVFHLIDENSALDTHTRAKIKKILTK